MSEAVEVMSVACGAVQKLLPKLVEQLDEQGDADALQKTIATAVRCIEAVHPKRTEVRHEHVTPPTE